MKKLLFLFIVVAAFAVGCSKSETASETAGTTGTATTPEAKSPISAYVGKYKATQGEVSTSVEIKADSKFELTIAGGSRSMVVKGDVVLDKEELKLTPTEIDGKTPTSDSDKKTETFKIIDGGKKLQPDGGPELVKE